MSLIFPFYQLSKRPDYLLFASVVPMTSDIYLWTWVLVACLLEARMYILGLKIKLWGNR